MKNAREKRIEDMGSDLIKVINSYITKDFHLGEILGTLEIVKLATVKKHEENEANNAQ